MNENNKLPEETDAIWSDNIITLEGENGEFVDFFLLDMVEYEGESYAITSEIVDGEMEEAVAIFHIVMDENGEEFFDGVDDDETLEAVFAVFQQQNPEDGDEE